MSPLRLGGLEAPRPSLRGKGAETNAASDKGKVETKGRGRPPKYPMPERIDASSEQIAEVVLLAKPKETWRYEEESGRTRRGREESASGG